MRLSDYQRQMIVQSVKSCFGTRTDEGRRGGDIDLLITTDMQDINDIVRAEMRCQVQLQQALGEQKIDMLIDYPNRGHYPAIFRIAEQSGISL